MGLPIRRLVLATNENDVLDEFFRTGRYRPRKAAETHATSSPSMDISKASNFERFIWDAVDRDGDKVAWLWKQVEEEGGFDLSTDRAWEKIEDDSGFVSGRSSHDDRIATIRLVQGKVRRGDRPAHGRRREDRASPARAALSDDLPRDARSPAKFDETIVEALGVHAPRPPRFEGIERLPQRVAIMKPDPAAVKKFIAERAR